MKIEPFEANVRFQDQVAIVDMRGEINALAEADLSSAYLQADKDKFTTIILNFGDVSYINSTGIAVIIGLLIQARKNQQKIIAYGLSDHYQEIFRITRLAEFIDIYADESSALQGNSSIKI